MIVAVLIVGIGLLLGGLLTVGLGIQLDLSFGNTLILVGAILACTGLIMLAFWTVIRELQDIARRLGSGVAIGGSPLDRAADRGGFLPGLDQAAPENAGKAAPVSPPSPAPWQEEGAGRDRGRQSAPEPPEEAAPAVKPKRNLLFSSSSRKERERAQARTTDPLVPEFRPAPPPASPAPAAREAPPPATFDEAWPQPERARAGAPPPPRRERAPSTFPETNAAPTGPDRYPPAAPKEDQPPVTVLKSGVVDGMAYSLYSDGSIEAQMPEGMMRFASIDELRSHLDQRP
jgi:hypothetical protein